MFTLLLDGLFNTISKDRSKQMDNTIHMLKSIEFINKP